MNPFFLFHILGVISCSTPCSIYSHLDSVELKRFVNTFYMIICTYKVNVLFYYFHIHSGGNFILGAPTFLDPPPQETHLTPTAPREGQRPDLTNRGQNQVLLEHQRLNPLPGEDQRLNPLPGEDQGLNPLPEEDQGLNPLPGEDQGLDPLPGDQGLAVLDTAVAMDISPDHTRPDPGERGTVCTAGLKI